MIIPTNTTAVVPTASQTPVPVSSDSVLQTSPSAPQASPLTSLPANEAPMMVLDKLLSSLRSEAEAAHQARISGIARGAITGLTTLDRELGGAFAPGLHFVDGNAGAGKTAFAWQVAATCRVPCLFVTCEMAPIEMLRRLTARETRTYLGRLKSGEMTGQDVFNLAARAIERVPHLVLLDATQFAARPDRIRECAEATRNRLEDVDDPIGNKLLIVIDSLHSWAARFGQIGISEYENLNAAVMALQGLSARLACPILVVTERNRGSMERGGLNSGAGTRKIEYGGETVINLDRERDAKTGEESEPDGQGEVAVTLRLAKNRNGAAGKKISLRFSGAVQAFRETSAVSNWGRS